MRLESAVQNRDGDPRQRLASAGVDRPATNPARLAFTLRVDWRGKSDSGDDDKKRRTSTHPQSHPRRRARRAASTRLDAPSLPIASDR